MDNLPSYDLELKAADERQRLHATMEELRSSIKDTLDVNKNVREHLGTFCGVAAVIGLVSGYAITGILVHQ